MFFQTLHAILRHTALHIIASPAPGGQISLIVMPRPDGTSEKALAKPIHLTGTPAELDEQLASELAGYVEAYNGVRSNLGETVEELKVAASKPPKSGTKKRSRDTTNKRSVAARKAGNRAREKKKAREPAAPSVRERRPGPPRAPQAPAAKPADEPIVDKSFGFDLGS